MTSTAQRPCRATRNRLLISCASIALATVALLPEKAHAQAFQGTISGTTGTVTRTNTSGTSETINVGSSTATINWTPTGQPNGNNDIDFLPTGNVATFVGPSGGGDYTVLNRIIPDGAFPIELNGKVLSFLSDQSTTGGNIWFYSPNGILIGASAVFNVGGLLLTTADPGSNWSTSANGFTATMGQANDGTKIRVLSGAQITANNYVAMIAPRIEQGGAVKTGGSAAYVAAEQLTMTLNQGLFDIAVDVGTNDPNGIVHTGSTTGIVNPTDPRTHGIYMVAVPKNQALTMLLNGGQVGFTDANGAAVQNGQVILSAGYGVSHTDSGQVVLDDPDLGVNSGIQITGGKYTSSLFGFATGDILAQGSDGSGPGGTLEFDGDLTLQGVHSSMLQARSGDSITIAGDADISADDLKYFVATQEGDVVDAQGGSATILAQSGGSIVIAGNATVSANASATINTATGIAGTARGGTAKIDADGGNISIDGNATIEAIAFGDIGHDGFDGHDSFGGTADLFASQNASLTIAGNLSMSADGDGSMSGLSSLGTGGKGWGGYVDFSADTGGSVMIGGTTTATANGIGGAVSSADGTGGEGQGGEVDLTAFTGGTITFHGDALFVANGTGDPGPGVNALPGEANPAFGGDGDGGEAFMEVDGGSIAADGKLVLGADGFGGPGTSSGGDGFGGYAFAELGGSDGAGGSLDVAGDFVMDASGFGGAGLANPDGVGGDGGDGYGGSASLFSTQPLGAGSTLNVQLSNVGLFATGSGGIGGDGLSGGAGGTGYGGESFAEFDAGNITASSIFADADGVGGTGGAGSTGAGGNGGDAYGGFAFYFITTPITADLSLSANSFGGWGGSGSIQGNGGNAEGQGFALLDIESGGQVDGDVRMTAIGIGGTGATGGEGLGGTAEMFVDGGILNASSVNLNANGTGGNGTSGDGGYSEGGDASLFIDAGGSVNVTNDLFIDAVANADFNGDGSADGGAGAANGGDSDGGFAGIFVSGGSLSVGGSTTITARAVGGAGGALGDGSGGSGGYGHGGEVEFEAGSTSCAQVCGEVATAATTVTNIAVHDVSMNATGRGGAGGNSTVGGAGGEGDGGSIYFDLGQGTTFTAGNITANGRGAGGNGGTGSAGLGGDGGLGQGGSVEMTVAVGASLTGETYHGFANSQGGDGGTGSTGFGDGGSAISGSDSATIDGTAVFGGSVDSNDGFIVTSFAQGGNGANGGSAQGGDSTITVNGSLTAAGMIQATGQALGGTGWSGAGGDGTGGNASIDVNGSLSSGEMFIGAGATAGNGVTAGGNAFGGFADLDVAGGSATIGSGGALIATNATAGTASAGSSGTADAGSSSVESTDGGNLAADSLTISAKGDLGTGSVAISAGTGCDCTPGIIAAGDLTLMTSNDLNVQTIGDAITVSGKLDLESGGDLTFADIAAGSFEFDARGNVTGGNIDVSDHVGGQAQGAISLGDINVSGPPSNSNDFSVGIASATSITVGDVNAVGNVGFATFGNLTTGNITSGDVFLALVGGDATLGSVTTASDGQVYIANASMFEDAGGPDNFDPSLVLGAAPVATGGSITINGSVTTGTLQAAAGTDLTLNAVDASNSVDVSAGGLASFFGIVSAPDITVTSGDIDIAAGASLGVAGVTDLVTLNAVSGSPIIVGDQGISPSIDGQYVLNEAGTIVADNVVLNAVGVDGGAAPDIDIFNYNIDGSTIASMTFNTAGSIIVQGALDFINADATDALNLNAGNNIEVITDTGSISMTDSSDGLAGLLTLNADNVWVADQSIISQLEQDPTSVTADQLAANDGPDNPDGYVSAGGITADIGSTFLVQNSGTATDVGGLTVGDGGLTINSGFGQDVAAALAPPAATGVYVDN